MIQIDGAIVREQGQTFAIVIVKNHILHQIRSEIEDVRSSFVRYFNGMPIILAGQASNGIFSYDGRRDIVRFLANLHPNQIPWKRYTFEN